MNIRDLNPCDNSITLNSLVDLMYPDISREERTSIWNATRVLAIKEAIQPLGVACGSGKHRRYDPIWIALAKTLLILKEHYRVHSDVLIEIGQFLWEKRSMLVNCPGPVVYYGSFWDAEQKDWIKSFRLVSSAVPKNFMHPADAAQGQALHHIAVSIDMAPAMDFDPTLIQRHG